MNYNIVELKKSDVPVISNDPRKSPSVYWLKKTGMFVEPSHTMLHVCEMVVLSLFVLGLRYYAKKKRLPFVMKVRPILLSPHGRVGNWLSRRKCHPKKPRAHDHET